MQVRILAGVLSVLCLTTASISPAYGQATATLTGTVLDTTGAALPAATITAHHTGTNVATDTITTAQGTFSIPALPPGTYTVTVTLDGFKTGVYQDVVLNAGVPTALARYRKEGDPHQMNIVYLFKVNKKIERRRCTLQIPPGVFDAVMNERAARAEVDLKNASNKKLKKYTECSIAFTEMIWGVLARVNPSAGCVVCSKRVPKQMRCDMYCDPAYHHYIFWVVCSLQCGKLASTPMEDVVGEIVRKAGKEKAGK